MQIQVKHKTVYGNELFYPENPLAKTLLNWKGAKSFTKNEGFSIEMVAVSPLDAA